MELWDWVLHQQEALLLRHWARNYWSWGTTFSWHSSDMRNVGA